ncbi:MAG: helix-turn-helix domain-containing protein [Candidatus Hodarchaeales archaeon]|jgi:hypothetical protein
MKVRSIVSPQSQKLQENRDLKELHRLLSLKGAAPDGLVQKIMSSLKQMQKELDLSSLHPIKQHFYYYQNLEEIRRIFLFTSWTYTELNELYIEIAALKRQLELPEAVSISNIVKKIQQEEETFLNLSKNSLLFRVLIYSSLKDPNQEKVTLKPKLIHKIDQQLYEILLAYGPLSRPELVNITGTPRSSLYDSLRRLELKGYISPYPDKNNRVGRPSTLFDVIL